MKTRTLLTLVFAVLLVVVGTIWIRSLVPPESPTGSLAFLSAAPELPIFERDGKRIDLSKEKGRLLVVHFWATWCPPCVEEIPALSKFWDQYRGRSDIVLFAISVNKDWKTIDEFTAKNPNRLPIYQDPNAATAARFGTTQYPETYIVNKAGRVLYRIQGGVEWSNAEIKQRIDQLLQS
jgi:thiol-disulfide isomerase/thioredoxin